MAPTEWNEAEEEHIDGTCQEKKKKDDACQLAHEDGTCWLE